VSPPPATETLFSLSALRVPRTSTGRGFRTAAARTRRAGRSTSVAASSIAALNASIDSGDVQDHAVRRDRIEAIGMGRRIGRE